MSHRVEVGAGYGERRCTARREQRRREVHRLLTVAQDAEGIGTTFHFLHPALRAKALDILFRSDGLRGEALNSRETR